MIEIDAQKKTQIARAKQVETLAESDAKMARIGEDLIDVLIAKNVISESDLPSSAQAVLQDRKTRRSKI